MWRTPVAISIRERANVSRGFTAAMMKGARGLQRKMYLSPENLAILAKYTGAREGDIRSTNPLLYDPDPRINTK
jgi:hypothetical protein